MIDKSIFRYILRYTKRDQVFILMLTLLSFPVVYWTLEVPKRIINGVLSDPEKGHTSEFLGKNLTQVELLIWLCFMFLGLVLINGAIKYVLNIYRGYVGERMLKQLRFQLFTRLLRFPLQKIAGVSQGEIIPIITAETEPLGGFIGEAFALPIFQGGLLITYLIFIFNQNPYLGLAATALYPFQLYFIPKLQRIVNALGRERVLAVRSLGDRLGESINGIREIHGYAKVGSEHNVILRHLHGILQIRLQIFRRKFFIKFLNNFLAKITPFFFYSFGGYYVLQGELTLGALLASIAAYQDLESPWKELLKYYQTTEDIRIKYEQITNRFELDDLIDEKLLGIEPLKCFPSGAMVRVENLRLLPEYLSESKVNFNFKLNEHLAVFGNDESGATELGLLLARLNTPEIGKLSIDNTELKQLTLGSMAAAMVHIGQVHIFTGNLSDNMFYALTRSEPVSLEEVQTGELESKVQSLSCKHKEEILALLHDLGISENIYEAGLETLVSEEQKELQQKIMLIRERLEGYLQETGEQCLVEFYDVNKYNSNLAIVDNIVFGTFDRTSLSCPNLPNHPLILQALKETGAYLPLLKVGKELTAFMLELFGDLSQDETLNHFMLIDSDEQEDYQRIHDALETTSVEKLPQPDKAMVLKLSFKLTVARHRLDLIHSDLQAKLVAARKRFIELGEASGLSINIFHQNQYHTTCSIMGNILFGAINYNQANASQRIRAIIKKLLEEASIYDQVIYQGFKYDVGLNGKKLKPTSRQIIAIVRALVAKPQMLIINHATQILTLDKEIKLLEKIRRLRAGKGLLWISSRKEHGQYLPRVICLEKGAIKKEYINDSEKFSD